MELAEEFEMASAFSHLSLAGTSAPTRNTEVHSLASSAQSESPMLRLSSSKEADVLSIKAGYFEDSPPFI